MATTLIAARRAVLTSASVVMAGLTLVFVGFGMAVCAVVDVIGGGDAVGALLASGAICILVGLGLWRLSAVPTDIQPRHVFAAVTVAWLAAAIGGALPFVWSGLVENLDDAFFESMSGFTCTGSTILSTEQFETGSPGVMFWRQMSQWFGGMGMIVLAVAVLPFLGVGGLDLIKAEAPGPESDRLAPRVSETAKHLWFIYAGFTAISTVVLFVLGMSLYDAVGHSFTLVSTGGFSTHAESIGFFDSVPIEVAIMVGMTLGAMSFSLHWRMLRRGPGVYLKSWELRAYLWMLVLGVVATTAILVGEGVGWGDAIRNGSFDTITLGTSTGFGNASPDNVLGDFVVWPAAGQIILLLLMASGGMTGSTSGGVKVLRMSVLVKAARRELRRVRSPRSVSVLKEGRRAIPDTIVGAIVGFGLLYFAIGVVGAIVVVILGGDLVSSMTGSVSALGNMGPALGEAGPTASWTVFTRPARFVLAGLMLVGRLELFAVALTAVVAFRRVQKGARRFTHREAGAGTN